MNDCPKCGCRCGWRMRTSLRRKFECGTIVDPETGEISRIGHKCKDIQIAQLKEQLATARANAFDEILESLDSLAECLMGKTLRAVENVIDGIRTLKEATP